MTKKRMFNRIKEWFFGRITEEDARNTYLPISTELNSLLKGLKTGTWYIKFEEEYFENIKLTNLDKLMPELLQAKLNQFFDRQLEFNNLREKAKKSILTYFSDMYDSSGYKGNSSEELLISFFSITSKNKFSFKNFNIPQFKIENKKEFSDLKKNLINKKNVRKFLSFLKETIKEAEELSKKLIKTYKKDTLIPEARKTILTITTIILTLILAGATIFTAYKSNVLIERQIESISPLNPEIRFFVNDKDDLMFSNFQLANPRTYFEDGIIETWRKERLYVIFQNIGQLPTGALNMNIAGHNLHSPSQYTENIPGKATSGVPFDIWYENCGQMNTGEECKRELVPLGIQYLNITIKCQYCEEEVTGQLQVCVYNQTKNECNELFS